MIMAMFGNNSTAKEHHKEDAVAASSQTLIGKGAFLVGDMQIYGPLRLDGEMSGSIVSKSRVVLGESAKLIGNLKAQNAEISGEIEGNIEVVEILTLKPSAHIKGDIACNKLIIEPGAKFNGKCDMSQPIKEIKLDERKASSPKGKQVNHEENTPQPNAQKTT